MIIYQKIKQIRDNRLCESLLWVSLNDIFRLVWKKNKKLKFHFWTHRKFLIIKNDPYIFIDLEKEIKDQDTKELKKIFNFLTK